MGLLVGLRNLRTGDEYLKAPLDSGNPFAIFHDFKREFRIHGLSALGDDPASITKKSFSPRNCVSVTPKQLKKNGVSILALDYRDRSGTWLVRLKVRVPAHGESSFWTMQVRNVGKRPVRFMGVFPFIAALRLGSGESNLMTVQRNAGFIAPAWSDRGGIYGVGLGKTGMSMQWASIFDERKDEAFSVIVRDAKIQNKEFRFLEPSIRVRYFPPEILKPGESRTFPETQLMISRGDWKKAALEYRRWFSRFLKPVKHPAWVKKIDGHVGQWVRAPGQPGKVVKGLSNTMDSFKRVPDVFRKLPVGAIEFAFFCRGAMGKKLSGKRYTHTDGDNRIREDLGGPAALREGIRRANHLGFHVTLYVDGYIFPEDSDEAQKGDAWDWVIKAKDGSLAVPAGYRRKGWLPMCPGSKGYQDFLARNAARLVRETGADGIRLDSLGAYFLPCYNPKHKHAHPFTYNEDLCELLKKVAAAVRRVNPNCLLTTEGSADFLGRYFNGALMQIYPKRDVPTMRLAVPDYIIFAHNEHGPVAASLTGYPGGCGGRKLGYLSKLDKLWRCARFPVDETVRWGEPSLEPPRPSRRDAICRLFRGEDHWVLVGARPAYKKSCRGHWGRMNPADLFNWDVGLKRDEVSYSVRVGGLPKDVRKARLCDVRSLRIEEVPLVRKGKDTLIKVKSNWFVAVFPAKGARPLANVSLPDVLRPGKSCEIEFSCLDLKRKRRPGFLFAPGLGLAKDGEGVKVSVPGRFRLTVPRGTVPGSYLLTLEGPGFMGCKRFVDVR